MIRAAVESTQKNTPKRKCITDKMFVEVQTVYTRKLYERFLYTFVLLKF